MSEQRRDEFAKFVRINAARLLHPNVDGSTRNDPAKEEMLKKINAFLDDPVRNRF
jgi:hypothetical protein